MGIDHFHLTLRVCPKKKLEICWLALESLSWMERLDFGVGMIIVKCIHI